MKKILLLFMLAIMGSSCAKKTVVAAFAPSAVVSEPSKSDISLVEKPHVTNAISPSNPASEAISQEEPQTGIEASNIPIAAPIAAIAPKQSFHVDRILDAAPVSSQIQKASFKKHHAAPRGARNWAPQLKIGLTLLAIGVVLAVFGLGFVGGLSALIGLLFTIVGLLVSY
jgi:hypothetical protein